jgi:hypothetical protein
VGTITTGVWQGTTVAVNQGGTGVTSLGSINISSFNNNSGFTSNTGDITNVSAGTDISGGGSSGSVTITLDTTLTSVTSMVNSSLIVQGADGNTSAGNVTYSFQGDTDTGMYRSASGQISFSNNATERFQMDADGDFHADADVIAYSGSVSDITLKENVTPITNALDVINQIDAIRFKYDYEDGYHYGVKAQQVEKILPEIVKRKNLQFHTGSDAEDMKLVVRDKELIPFLIEAVKELAAKIGK